MLPLISNALPPAPSSATSSPTPSALTLQSIDAAASASRQQMATAVAATAAPVAYFASTSPAREAASNERIQRLQAPAAGEYVEVEQIPAPPPQVMRPSVPVTLGIPLTTQLTAQFMAQQQAAQTARYSADPFVSKAEPEAAPVVKKETPFGKARGAVAYNIAALRAQEVNSAPDPDAAV